MITFMKNIKMTYTKYTLVALFLCFFFLGQAQKFGHINSQELLVNMQEIKTADEQLLAYQKQLEDEFVTKGQAFEEEYKAFVERANSGDFPQIQLQKEQEALAVKQQNLQNLQSQSQQKILQKREELYAPILKLVEDAVQAVGKEQEYTMIFDSSLGVMLHGDESKDVSTLVKAKLSM